VRGLYYYSTCIVPAELSRSITKEKIQAELTKLRKKQSKAWEDEPFGGLSAAEKSEYDERTERINDLEKQLASSPQLDAAAQAQKRGWSEDAETDIPQGSSDVWQPRSFGKRLG
jgi:hypothetical protein